MSSVSICKPIADFFRNYCLTSTSTKIKASHAHEMVAAFFGHKSNISLLNDRARPMSALGDTVLLIPDIELMSERRKQLCGFSEALPPTKVLAKTISEFILKEQYFEGKICLADNLQTYIADTFLPSIEEDVLDKLSRVLIKDVTAFDFGIYYDEQLIFVNFKENSLEIAASGICTEKLLQGKAINGISSNFNLFVTIPTVAGKRCFGNLDIKVSNSAKDAMHLSRVSDSAVSILQKRIETATSALDRTTNEIFRKIQSTNELVEKTIGGVQNGIFETYRRHAELVENSIGGTIAKMLEAQESQFKLLKSAIGDVNNGAFDQYQHLTHSIDKLLGDTGTRLIEGPQVHNKPFGFEIDGATSKMFKDYLLHDETMRASFYDVEFEKVDDYINQYVIKDVNRASSLLDEYQNHHVHQLKIDDLPLFNHERLYGEVGEAIKKLQTEDDAFLSMRSFMKDVEVMDQIYKLPAGIDNISSIQKLSDDLMVTSPTHKLMEHIGSANRWDKHLDSRGKLESAFDALPSNQLSRAFFDLVDDEDKTQE